MSILQFLVSRLLSPSPSPSPSLLLISSFWALAVVADKAALWEARAAEVEGCAERGDACWLFRVNFASLLVLHSTYPNWLFTGMLRPKFWTCYNFEF